MNLHRFQSDPDLIYKFFLELKAYSSVVDALRAGGELTEEKSGLLEQLRSSLRISTERHKTEVRRALNNEILNTVANR